MSDENPIVLEFEDVALKSVSHRVSDLLDVSLALRSKELTLVRIEEGSEMLPLADLSQGLVRPDKGDIRFMGENWKNMSPHRQTVLRGRMGRVFEANGWVSSLTVMSNVTLSQHHHTNRNEEDILREINEFAQAVGLSGVPDKRPSQIRRDKLKQLEWVRAFIGSPALVLLESPEMWVSSAGVNRLIDITLAACGKGSTVMWITLESRIWNDDRLSNCNRYIVNNSRMEVC